MFLTIPMTMTVIGRKWMQRNTSNSKMKTMYELYFKDEQPIIRMIPFQYTITTIPILASTMEMVQVKVCILRILIKQLR